MIDREKLSSQYFDAPLPSHLNLPRNLKIQLLTLSHNTFEYVSIHKGNHPFKFANSTVFMAAYASITNPVSFPIGIEKHPLEKPLLFLKKLPQPVLP